MRFQLAGLPGASDKVGCLAIAPCVAITRGLDQLPGLLLALQGVGEPSTTAPVAMRREQQVGVGMRPGLCENGLIA